MAETNAAPLLFFLGLFCLSSGAIAALQFDFFYLELMWPGTYCKNTWGGCCLPTTGEPAEDFFVQAMLPTTISGNLISDCTKKCSFGVNVLKALIDDLYAYWSDVRCPSNNGKNQWESVWCTYGVCSNLTEVEYFKRALALRERVDLLSVLNDYGIVPSQKKSYSLTDVETALLVKLGASTIIECTKTGLWRFQESWLSKIYVCVASDGKTLITCPVQKKKTCDDKVKFYPFSSNMLKSSADQTSSNPIKLPSEEALAV